MKIISGEATALSVLVLFIADLVLYYNVGKSMNPGQIETTARLILQEYKNYRPEHLKICFDRIKLGRYGKIYDRIDGGVIMDFIKEFDLEMEQEIMMERENESQRNKELMKTPFSSALTGLKIDVGINIREEESKPVIAKDPREEKIQGWMRDFDKIHRDHGLDTSIRMIIVEDKKMDVTTYLKYRLENETNQ